MNKLVVMYRFSPETGISKEMKQRSLDENDLNLELRGGNENNPGEFCHNGY